MSNRRRFRAASGKRAAMIAEAVLTAGMVAEWKADPASVPVEWRDFWESHSGPVEPSDEQVREPGAVREATILDGLAALVEQRDSAEHSVAVFVAQARAAGHTWAELAEVLGVTRQAAQQRYGL